MSSLEQHYGLNLHVFTRPSVEPFFRGENIWHRLSLQSSESFSSCFATEVIGKQNWRTVYQCVFKKNSTGTLETNFMHNLNIIAFHNINMLKIYCHHMQRFDLGFCSFSIKGRFQQRIACPVVFLSLMIGRVRINSTIRSSQTQNY